MSSDLEGPHLLCDLWPDAPSLGLSWLGLKKRGLNQSLLVKFSPACPRDHARDRARAQLAGSAQSRGGAGPGCCSPCVCMAPDGGHPGHAGR